MQMILVTGASGNVGSEVVRALLGSGEKVRALTRGTASAALPAGVEVAVGDLDRPETVDAASAGARAVFLLPGYADMAGVVRAIRLAGVERIVLLTSGAAANGDLTNAVERGQILSENAVRESGLEWTILRPSGFTSNALRWLPQLHAGDVVREPFPDVAVASIDPFDIAAVAALALTTAGHDGQTYRLTGPESLLPAENVAILGEVIGRNLRFDGYTDAEAREVLSAVMPSEYVDAMFQFFVEGTYDDSKVLPTVRELTGQAPRTFEQWAVTHADAFR
jgi:uncharacterized protein YbjT (DUF2867 family)